MTMHKTLLLACLASFALPSFAQQDDMPEIFEPEVYMRNPAAVPAPPPPVVLPYMSGAYISLKGGLNYNYGYFGRRYNGVNVIWALAHPTWNWHGKHVSPAVGFDFFNPCQVPVRLELAETVYSKESRQITGVLVLPEGVPAGLNQFANDKIQVWTLMANAYLDWHTPYAFTPYLGVGAGAARIKTRHTGYLLGPIFGPSGPATAETTRWRNTQFAWNAMLGVNYNISYNLSFQLQGSYTNLGKVNFVAGSTSNVFYLDKNLQSYGMELGLRWSFC